MKCKDIKCSELKTAFNDASNNKLQKKIAYFNQHQYRKEKKYNTIFMYFTLHR